MFKDVYGPIHLLAMCHFLQEGSIHSRFQVSRRSTGETMTVAEALLPELLKSNALPAPNDAHIMHAAGFEIVSWISRGPPPPAASGRRRGADS